MKFVVRFAELLMLCSLFAMVSCSDSDDNGATGGCRRTVIFYMAAQNSLGSSNCVREDSVEIVNGAINYLAKNDNIIMFIDDAKNPRIQRVYKDSNGKCYTRLVYQYDYDANSADAATLLDVLTRIKSLYPSESYGLVMWSHGMGWLPEVLSVSVPVRSICIDVGPGGIMSKDIKSNGTLGFQMSIESMASAIQQSGVHFDYIFFDACLMQCLEVAWPLRNVTDYMVSSPTQTAACGAYYTDQIKKGFFVYPTNDENIRSIVDTYFYDVTENPVTKGSYDEQGCVMSVIKMSELENLAAATIPCMKTALSDKRVRNLSGLMTGYVSFDYTGYPDCYDPSVAFSKLLPEEEYNNWLSALNRCVVYKKATDTYYIGSRFNYNIQGTTDKEHCSCVSMFFPQDKYTKKAFLDFNNAIKDTDWYKVVWPKDEE